MSTDGNSTSTTDSSGGESGATSPRNSQAGECPICYETFWSEKDGNDGDVATSTVNSLERITISDCGHEFCRECLRQHCKHALSKKQVPIPCPLQTSSGDHKSCKSCLGVMLVRALLLQEDVKAQNRDEYLANFLNEITSDNPKPIFRSKRPRSDTQSSSATPPTAKTTSRTISSSTSSSQTSQTPLSNLYGSLGENTGGGSSSDSSLIIYSDDEESDPPAPTEQEFDWIQFQRLHRLSVNKTLVPCTRCSEPVNTHCPKLIQTNVSGSDDDLMESGSHVTRRPVTCLGCNHSFCSIHGDAHPTMSCDDYLRNYKPDEEIRKSERAIRKFCKPCSHCQAPIQKSSGCDHIICPSCNNDMCFNCGTHLYMEGKSMVRNCTKCNQAFIDHRYMGRYRIFLCLALPFYFPFMLLHMVLTGAVALATCGCFCCFGCGIKAKPSEGSKGEGKGEEFEFRPRQAVQSVLGIIFLPFVDLFHQCGLSCCCRDNVLWQEQEEHRKADKADGDEEYVDDEEFQLRVLSTVPTHEDSQR